MNEPLENLYFNWLCAKVIRVEVPTPSLTYWRLLRELHNTEFVWLLSGDDNRAEDGLELRYEFVLEADIPDDPIWRSIGCSVFEMIIALSRRAEFITNDPTAEWFWKFISNLNLDRYNDAFNVTSAKIASILYKFVWRQYNFNGRGGMFPLRKPHRDQRDIEMWYQFGDYLEENEYLEKLHY